MVTLLAIMFMAALFGLGARPYRRAAPPCAQPALTEARSGAESGLYDEAPARRESVQIILGGNKIIHAAPKQLTPISYLPLSEVKAYFTARRAPEVVKPNPPCFVCGTTLSLPYPDRDYFCEHCQKFISVRR